MIEEKYIEDYLNQLESDVLSDHFLKESEFVNYLNSDVFTSLNDDEKRILFFCCEVLYNATRLSKNEAPEINLDQFFANEENNWSVREDYSSWSETKDIFFKDSPEEDLLAFVEDILADDEESLSEISKEIIFITSKSLIESFQFSAEP